jgi:hypothetical protein
MDWLKKVYLPVMLAVAVGGAWLWPSQAKAFLAFGGGGLIGYGIARFLRMLDERKTARHWQQCIDRLVQGRAEEYRLTMEQVLRDYDLSHMAWTEPRPDGNGFELMVKSEAEHERPDPNWIIAETARRMNATA